MNNNQHDRKKLRGVNLGGWLVLERWMTPSLFEGTDVRDEYNFMSEPDAAEKLEWHRETFITKADFKWIAEHGLNAVRVPVGYWILDGDGQYISGIRYLDMAIEEAGKYGLKVLIDLHGAKGSQNGYDHSGRAGNADWYRSKADQEDTVKIVSELARRYRGASALWGIELLNEPKVGPRTFLTLKKFYREAYQQLFQYMESGMNIVFSDAFMPRMLSGTLKEVPDYPVLMDVHWYQFGKTNLKSYFDLLKDRPAEIRRLQQKQPVIVGEWSGMLSHETLAGKSEIEKEALQRQHLELQLTAYAPAAGWFYWTYKTEAPGVWNFRWLIENNQLSLE